MRKQFYLSLAGALATCACTPVSGGKLAATRTGDLSNALSERVAPTAELQGQCGTGELTLRGAEQLERAPYLQRVSDTTALVLFTVTNGAEPPAVSLSLPSGQAVHSVQAERDPSDPRGLQWMARFTQLEPGGLYCYALTDLSEPVGFRTAPRAFTEAPVRFVVFGDSGRGGSMQDAVREQLDTVPFDLILHTGDIVYDGGSLPAYESDFFAEYSEFLASVPAFPTSGNHDYEVAEAGAYRQVFALPENGGPQGVERWYSFDWGDVHFVALDTERLGDAQTGWLSEDLARNELPWTVAYLHRPPYSSGYHGSAERVRDAFSPLFEQHGVQVVFAGHDHNYERTRAINGVTYVVTGGGGHGTRGVGRSSFTAFSEDVLHFVHAEVRGSTMLLHAIDAAGQEFDSLRVERDPGGALTQ